MFLNDEEARWDNLEREVKLRLEKNPNLIILIRTHRDAPYEYMIRAFDAVKAAGGKKVGLGIIGGEG